MFSGQRVSNPRSPNTSHISRPAWASVCASQKSQSYCSLSCCTHGSVVSHHRRPRRYGRLLSQSAAFWHTQPCTVTEAAEAAESSNAATARRGPASSPAAICRFLGRARVVAAVALRGSSVGTVTRRRIAVRSA